MNLEEKDIDKKVLAIVCFGPPTSGTGTRPADYYQVTIDPNTCSPSGDFIRFGMYAGDEITGWQRVGAMTIVEVLGDSEQKMHDGIEGYTVVPDATVRMMSVE